MRHFHIGALHQSPRPSCITGVPTGPPAISRSTTCVYSPRICHDADGCTCPTLKDTWGFPSCSPGTVLWRICLTIISLYSPQAPDRVPRKYNWLYPRYSSWISAEEMQQGLARRELVNCPCIFFPRLRVRGNRTLLAAASDALLELHRSAANAGSGRTKARMLCRSVGHSVGFPRRCPCSDCRSCPNPSGCTPFSRRLLHLRRPHRLGISKSFVPLSGQAFQSLKHGEHPATENYLRKS